MLIDQESACILVSIVSLCDGYFKLKESDIKSDNERKIEKFFKIAIQLPFDIQMILSRRMVGLSTDLTSSVLLKKEFLNVNII